jgi:histidinol dehydrogenase
VVTQAARRKTVQVFGRALTPREVVRRIIDEVREDGDAAVLKYLARIDGVRLKASQLAVRPSEMAGAARRVPRGLLDALRLAKRNIALFQHRIRPKDWDSLSEKGRMVGVRHTPIESVGVFVPGGAAVYPSSLLMSVIPAQVAGVERTVVVSVPRRDGTVTDELLAAAHVAGVKEMYRIGGVAAIAALAYGTRTIPRVAKIIGPGNLFITLAKREVFGDVGIDFFAGPSEIVIIADETARPEFVAADLISQAEHAPGVAILVTHSKETAKRAQAALVRQLATLPRAAQARESLANYGAVVLTRSVEESVKIANELAPEHLEVCVRDPHAWLDRIRNAGAVFLGHYTPESVGDYVAGPSHVLPTGGTARFFSGLSVYDFMKRTSVMSYERSALAAQADAIETIAAAEGLDGHGRAVCVRVR